jgi:hypothetical protein
MGVMTQRATRARELVTPWAGLLGGGFGWFLTQQVGSNQIFDNCGSADPLFVLFIGLAGLVMAGGGAWLALPVWRGPGAAHGARRFIAITGIGMAALFALAIILQTAASLIIPRCFG